MKIINPLYDLAFKYLMENRKLARQILSVILEEDITEVELTQQETTLPYERRGFALLCLDFKAVIKQTDGSHKTVLIELQKSKSPTDIERFRNYLAASYRTGLKEGQDALRFEEPKSPEYATIYPIIAIYILGYNLDDLPYMAVTVNRDIVNLVNKAKLDVHSTFIELLTHQSYIIQVKRLPEKPRSLLEKFLVLFDQTQCTQNRFILDLQQIPKEFSDVANYLEKPILDESFRRQMEAEEELDQIFTKESRYIRLIAEALEEKDEAEKREQEALRQKEEALLKANESRIKLARQMKKYGASNEEIARETELLDKEIEELS